jgi:hypothetical protein
MNLVSHKLRKTNKRKTCHHQHHPLIEQWQQKQVGEKKR